MKADTRAARPAIEEPAQPAAPQALLDQVIARSAPPQRIEGIVVGRLESPSDDGTPRVGIDCWGLTGLSARSLVPVNGQRSSGAPVALGFENGDPQRPIILGFMVDPQPQLAQSQAAPEVCVDGERIALVAEREIELRCGDAAIILTADGQIQLRGHYITSYATATQRILGGSVNLN